MFYTPITQDEIEDAVRFLVERHGEGAGEEALRLAEVGRRLGSRRNSALFRRAAKVLGGGESAPAESWRAALREFGRARIEDPPR
jgi:hypothetical protein